MFFLIRCTLPYPHVFPKIQQATNKINLVQDKSKSQIFSPQNSRTRQDDNQDNEKHRIEQEYPQIEYHYRQEKKRGCNYIHKNPHRVKKPGKPVFSPQKIKI